ncbi:MAG: phospholipase D-like domain-containing protein [Desulfobulbaceae bacterium]|nr:phospholipase D-like domain-containing protein [Desulfobulbaceae bacterium]
MLKNRERYKKITIFGTKPMLIVLILFVLLTANGLYHILKPIPPGFDFTSPEQPASSVELLTDLTYLDPAGQQHSQQKIYDTFFHTIRAARHFILLDVFLYNNFQGSLRNDTRPLAEELTTCLIEQKKRHPEISIIVISDPINTVYGSIPSSHFTALRAAGIKVVITPLPPLRDSNPLYSSGWRIFARPFGSGPGKLLPNPFGTGRISLRSGLKLLNFKANHRKVLIADQGENMVGLVTSANPHNGSSGHTNEAVLFNGPAVADLLTSELAVLDLAGVSYPAIPETKTTTGAYTVQILTEKAIKHAALSAINTSKSGDRIDLIMFYLSDRQIVTALKEAHQRGVSMRIVLDPNKDAFGRTRNGIPNRLTSNELHRVGIPIRWADTHGEQCHAKTLRVASANGRNLLITGSANFTRRNLDNLNLETDVAIRGKKESPFFIASDEFFNTIWNNENHHQCSVDYKVFADGSMLKYLLYRICEATGLSTF